MRTLRHPGVLAVAAVVALAVAAPGAAAKSHGPRLSIAPAKPNATDALRVTFRAPAALARGEHYGVEIRGQENGSDCRSDGIEVATGRFGAGVSVTVQLTANRTGSYIGWCAGKATAILMRNTAGHGWIPVRGFRRSFKIRSNPRFRPATFGTKVVVDVLPTSTATVTAPGRAERVLGLGGGLDGFIQGKFILNTDYRISLGIGAGNTLPRSADAVIVRSLVSDPLCSSPAVQTIAPMASGVGSSLLFLRTGVVTGSLVLASDPTTLAGCAGPDTGTTTLALSGVLGEKKLADLTLTGSTTGVPVGGGVSGTVSLALHLKVNIID
jgi:hypothetical protein